MCHRFVFMFTIYLSISEISKPIFILKIAGTVSMVVMLEHNEPTCCFKFISQQQKCNNCNYCHLLIVLNIPTMFFSFKFMQNSKSLNINCNIIIYILLARKFSGCIVCTARIHKIRWSRYIELDIEIVSHQSCCFLQQFW